MYDAMISRSHKGCLVFLIDQSGSMSDPCGIDATRSKAQMLADALNRLLATTVTRCTGELGRPARDYFDIAVIGYGSNAGVGPAFQGSLRGREWATVPEIESGTIRIDERMKQVDDGAGGLVETRRPLPVWIDPVAENGNPPMCAGLEAVRNLLRVWVQSHPANFPPIVFHITNGHGDDGDPSPLLSTILEIGTDDGRVLLGHFVVSEGGEALRLPGRWIRRQGTDGPLTYVVEESDRGQVLAGAWDALDIFFLSGRANPGLGGRVIHVTQR